jgi:cyd operon protein YbgT
MWYFSWILGVLFACSCGIINAMWVEMHLSGDRGDGITHDDPRKP